MMEYGFPEIGNWDFLTSPVRPHLVVVGDFPWESWSPEQPRVIRGLGSPTGLHSVHQPAGGPRVKPFLLVAWGPAEMVGDVALRGGLLAVRGPELGPGRHCLLGLASGCSAWVFGPVFCLTPTVPAFVTMDKFSLILNF